MAIRIRILIETVVCMISSKIHDIDIKSGRTKKLKGIKQVLSSSV